MLDVVGGRGVVICWAWVTCQVCMVTDPMGVAQTVQSAGEAPWKDVAMERGCAMWRLIMVIDDGH